jgi:hypothetical protein
MIEVCKVFFAVHDRYSKFSNNRGLAQLGHQGLIEVGLAEYGLLVALVFDLMDDNVLRPAELAGHADVKLAPPTDRCIVRG